MKKEKKNATTYETAEEFAKDMGISEIEIALLREKNRIIKKLTAKRMELGVSQADVARAVGTRRPAIARMESGQVGHVSMDFLAKVAMVLDASFNVRPKLAA